MSTAIKLISAGRMLTHLRRDLSRDAVADLAARLVKAGHVMLDRDGGVRLTDEGRAMVDATTPPAQPKPQPTTPAPVDVDALRAELANVRGDDTRAKVRRAALRDAIGRAVLGADAPSDPTARPYAHRPAPMGDPKK